MSASSSKVDLLRCVARELELLPPAVARMLSMRARTSSSASSPSLVAGTVLPAEPAYVGASVSLSSSITKSVAVSVTRTVPRAEFWVAGTDPLMLFEGA
jgi:hypothetical protein